MEEIKVGEYVSSLKEKVIGWRSKFMSDEEKQAVESLIEIREFANLSNYKDTKISQLNAIDIVLSLIEKQSKEIKELKEEKAKRQWVHIKENGEVEPLFYVSKDKIKAKIEYYEKIDNSVGKIVLQSLLKDGGDI